MSGVKVTFLQLSRAFKVGSGLRRFMLPTSRDQTTQFRLSLSFEFGFGLEDGPVKDECVPRSSFLVVAVSGIRDLSEFDRALSILAGGRLFVGRRRFRRRFLLLAVERFKIEGCFHIVDELKVDLTPLAGLHLGD